jgi:hypothetical protein
MGIVEQTSTELCIKKKTTTEKEKPIGVAILPFQHTTSYKISRLLRKFNTTVLMPVKKTSHMLRSVMDDLGLKASGVYSIPCECGKVYMGQTGKQVGPLRPGVKNIPVIYVYLPDKSAVAEQHRMGPSDQVQRY